MKNGKEFNHKVQCLEKPRKKSLSKQEQKYLLDIMWDKEIPREEIVARAGVTEATVSLLLNGKRWSERVVKAFLEYSPGDTMIYGILAKRTKRST